MVTKEVPSQKYAVYAAKGQPTAAAAVFQAWQQIWAAPLQRKYTFDFELYGKKHNHPVHPEAEVYIAIK